MSMQHRHVRVKVVQYVIPVSFDWINHTSVVQLQHPCCCHDQMVIEVDQSRWWIERIGQLVHHNQDATPVEVESGMWRWRLIWIWIWIYVWIWS